MLLALDENIRINIEVDIKYRVLRQGLNAVPFFRRKNAKLAGFSLAITAMISLGMMAVAHALMGV